MKPVNREAFEEWVSRRKVCTRHGAKLSKTSDGTYRDYRINDRWLAWKAASEQFEAVGYRARFFKEPDNWMLGVWGATPRNDNPNSESEVLYVMRGAPCN